MSQFYRHLTVAHQTQFRLKYIFPCACPFASTPLHVIMRHVLQLTDFFGVYRQPSLYVVEYKNDFHKYIFEHHLTLPAHPFTTLSRSHHTRGIYLNTLVACRMKPTNEDARAAKMTLLEFLWVLLIDT